MKIVELTATESEAVERAFYETKSYEMLLSVLNRQLNANANPETKSQGLFHQIHKQVTFC